MTQIYHYPPDLFNLLVQTIPLLCKSKRDTINFLKGSGIPNSFISDLINKVNFDRNSIGKAEIVRTVLERINENGDASLRERRELLKRVTEFENFEACWEKDRLPAKALVSDIRSLINVKDSFTRLNVEREKQVKINQEEYLKKTLAKERHYKELSSVKSQLYSLFSYTDAHKRGKELEVVLNRLFKAAGFSVREAFALIGDQGEGIIEQIDGVVEIDGELYLVEMKWWSKPIGNGEMAEHLVRLYSRGEGKGIFISNSSFTKPAINQCKDFLSKSVVCLCGLNEIVMALETGTDLKQLFKDKIQAAIVDKNPYHVIH